MVPMTSVCGPKTPAHKAIKSHQTGSLSNQNLPNIHSLDFADTLQETGDQSCSMQMVVIVMGHPPWCVPSSTSVSWVMGNGRRMCMCWHGPPHGRCVLWSVCICCCMVRGTSFPLYCRHMPLFPGSSPSTYHGNGRSLRPCDVDVRIARPASYDGCTVSVHFPLEKDRMLT